MVIETPNLPFLEWLRWSWLYWLVVVGSVTAAVLVLCFLVAALRHGPRAGLKIVWRVLEAGAADLAFISPRRVAALAWLAIKESIRRRVVVAFAVFIVILLFAGWFLDPGSDHPARLYLSFVLTATSYLVLALVLFLSAFSLPADIKSRTLHTVVTKPVRPSEIVLGRMLGFTAIGTILLVAMGLISYVFVARGLAHTHQVTEADLEAVKQAVGEEGPAPKEGTSSRAQNHRHKVFIDASGKGRLEAENGHWHELTATESQGKKVYTVGPPQGMLVARVPIYGKLRFKSRDGKPAKEGINVGDEWTYRSYLEGGTLAAAIWTFEGITPERFPVEKFPEGIPVEMSIGVFRTHKGNIEKGIPGSLLVRNPKTGDRVEAKIFRAKEFATDVQHIPHTLQGSGPEGRQLDLFKDLVSDDGKLEVWLYCLQPGQYFGAAQADMYLRARDASFVLNFAKGYLGIWLQMVLVIGIGVMFSTFLSGSVAMIATAGALVGGFFGKFMIDLATGELPGGGPFEALYRLLTQANLVSEMEPGLRTTVLQMLDVPMSFCLWVIAQILPDFGRFSYADHVAYGFNISSGLVGQDLLATFGFLAAVFVAGYFLLKTREVAK